MITPGSLLGMIEDWYDKYYIFGAIGMLILIIILGIVGGIIFLIKIASS